MEILFSYLCTASTDVYQRMLEECTFKILFDNLLHVMESCIQNVMICICFILQTKNTTTKMSSRAKAKKTTKKRAQRATSNVFAMFDQAQIQEFKEAFNMIDQNRDGFVDKEDLHDMLASLGKCSMTAWGVGAVQCILYTCMPREKGKNGTHPDSSVRLLRFHIVLYRCGYSSRSTVEDTMRVL